MNNINDLDMNNINRLLKDANLYSIEYCGYFILKFSISSNSIFYNKFENIEIEFISGCNILNSDSTNKSANEEVFNLYGSNILSVKFEEDNQLEIGFDNNSKILSILEEDELYDRNWIIRPVNNKDSYILNDSNEIFYTEDMKELITPPSGFSAAAGKS